MGNLNGRLVTELGYLGFEVSDLARWELFGTEVLGFACAKGPRPATRLLRMDERRHRIILTEGRADDCAFAGWQTSDSIALQSFCDRLDQLGIAWTRGTDDELELRGVQGMIHLKDPGENRHEIYHGPALAADRFASPRVAGGFVTRGEGLGHVVYASPVFPQIASFAQKVLGLSLSDQIRAEPVPGMTFEVSFFHTNTRHHSLAVGPQAPSPARAKRMHHFMIEANIIDDVGFARDRCLAMGQAVHLDLGQHPNDRMISFYGETPSGFLVEFGWGGIKVDDATWQTVTYNKLSEWGHRPSAAPAKTS